jgi:HK97 family phage major capsid protein
MNSKEIRSSINSLLMEQQRIATAGFTAESRTKFDKIQTDVEALEADLQRVEAMEQRNVSGAQFTPSPRPGVGDGRSVHQLNSSERRSRINEAFRTYARTGQIGAEYRDLLTTSDATGGALIPQEFSGLLIEALKYYGPIAARVAQKVTNNNGAPMKFSFANDTANSLTLLGVEGTSGPAETDPSFSSKIVGVDTVTGGLIKVSFQELDDSSFNLDTWLRSAFGVRYARGIEKAITLGTDGAGTALPNFATGGLLGQATVGTTTTALANGIGWDDLVNLYNSVDPAYANPDSNWVMNSKTRGYLLGLKDGFGRPFFTPDPTADNPFGKLLGFDVCINQSMPDTGTANVLAPSE